MHLIRCVDDQQHDDDDDQWTFGKGKEKLFLNIFLWCFFKPFHNSQQQKRCFWQNVKTSEKQLSAVLECMKNVLSSSKRDGGIRNLEFTFEKKILQNLFTLPTIKIIKSETSAPIARVEIKCKKEPKFEREMFLAFDNDFLSKSEHSKQKYKNIEEKSSFLLELEEIFISSLKNDLMEREWETKSHSMHNRRTEFLKEETQKVSMCFLLLLHIQINGLENVCCETFILGYFNGRP